MAKRDRRTFATNRDRSAIKIRSKSSKEIVGTVKPHSFYVYQSNATRLTDAAIKRRKRK